MRRSAISASMSNANLVWFMTAAKLAGERPFRPATRGPSLVAGRDSDARKLRRRPKQHKPSADEHQEHRMQKAPFQGDGFGVRHRYAHSKKGGPEVQLRPKSILRH